MVNEFDKEIDAMLRDMAKQDSFAQITPDLHLDTDEISAFAENALSDKSRLRITDHLADCSKCRKILATNALINAEIESEIIHDKILIAEKAELPWYRKILAVPNLVYGMGALALLLVGIIGLIVIQNPEKSDTVAQSDKRAEKVSGPNAGQLEADFTESNSYSASSVSNTNSISAANSVPSSSNTVANTANPKTKGADATSSAITEKLENSAVSREDEFASLKNQAAKPVLAAKEATRPITTPIPSTNDVASGGETINNRQVENLPTQTRNVQNITPDGINVQRSQNAPPPVSEVVEESRDKEEKQKAVETPKKKASAISPAKDSKNSVKSVGGKSFRNINNVWIDTSYSGGSVTTIKRGSDNYKKLDAGLQNIGNSLGGTVIVVWGGKNYKIQ